METIEGSVHGSFKGSVLVVRFAVVVLSSICKHYGTHHPLNLRCLHADL